jgi:hypothetical protein
MLYRLPPMLIALALLCAVMLMSAMQPAHAQDGTFVPLQLSHTGLWADPTRPGAGFGIDVAGEGYDTFASVTVYAGAYRVGEQPFWVVAYPPMHGANSGLVPLYRSNRVFNSPSVPDPELTQVGDLELHSVDCTHLQADLTYMGPDGIGSRRRYNLVPLTLPLADACITCDAGGFSPPDGRCVE